MPKTRDTNNPPNILLASPKLVFGAGYRRGTVWKGRAFPAGGYYDPTDSVGLPEGPSETKVFYVLIEV